jgi:hypothetical protein
MMMKTVVTLLAVVGSLFVFTPEAEARPNFGIRVYVSGHTSCGCPIHTRRVLVGYQSCGTPIYRYHRQPVRHQCRQYARPAPRHPHHIRREIHRRIDSRFRYHRDHRSYRSRRHCR